MSSDISQERCPKCGKLGFDYIVDEVDIGVGVQTHLRGGTCPDCGELSIDCDDCGKWDSQTHAKWCKAKDDDA